MNVYNKSVMSGIISIVLALLILIQTDASAAQAEVEAAIFHARDSVVSYFPTVEGKVVEIIDNKVKVKIDSHELARQGMRLSVFRKGEPFYHPITKEPIGNTETYQGTIEIDVKSAEDGLFACDLIDGDARKDDIVRISSSKIKLAFFQDRKADWSLSEVFYGFLKDSDRFEIIESFSPTFIPEDLSELAGSLGADVLLMLSTPLKDQKRVMNIKMYWTRDTKLFAEMEEPVGSGQVSVFAPEEEFISRSIKEMKPWGAYDLKAGELIAMGDVDNNGKRELVVSDGNEIRIYSIGDDLRELWFIEGPASDRHLSIDVLDLNKNGRAEIFVTSMTGIEPIDSKDREKINETTGMKAGWIKSFVLEYDNDRGYKRIADNISYFLRVAGQTLFMQKFSKNRLFSGPVHEGIWENGEYKPGRELSLPDSVNIYGFTAVDWNNNGEMQFLSFNDRGYLNLFDNRGELLWRSPKSYGKFDIVFERETQSMANPTEKKAMRGRLIPIQTARGQEVLAVMKVPIISKVPGLGHKEANVYSLWWDGSTMDETLILEDLSGTISDYWVEDRGIYLVARGSIFSFAKNALQGDLSRGSVLYYYHYSKK